MRQERSTPRHMSDRKCAKRPGKTPKGVDGVNTKAEREALGAGEHERQFAVGVGGPIVESGGIARQAGGAWVISNAHRALLNYDLRQTADLFHSSNSAGRAGSWEKWSR
jgi:hypothetical protein